MTGSLTEVNLSPEARQYIRKQRIAKVQATVDAVLVEAGRGMATELAQVHATIALANVMLLVAERLDEISGSIDDVTAEIGNRS